MRLSYPPELPISARKDEIVAAVRDHRVLVIAGDTGSGKTTQIPKMCVEAGRGAGGLIGCTQPRRIAAVSVAERVAEEVGDSARVGYKIRFRDGTTPDTLIKFMTDGVLLAETRRDKLLRRYDTIIIDEAHERSLNIDFLLGYLRQLLDRRPDLKLIIASATLDTEKFSAHFDSAPIINVTGRTYPVRIEYRPANDEGDTAQESHVDLAARMACEISEEHPAGDILIFMPTERDILDCRDMLQIQLGSRARILPLFGRLQAADQRKIFHPSPLRKIIVATNIAETSITVPGIRYVIDTGLARISRYNPRARTTSLQVARVSRASCEQRTGRCGRTGPGYCLRLFSEEDYLSRPQYTQPEIQRANLAEVILQMISLGLGDPRAFPFLDPPTVNSIRDGYRLLHELGAITTNDRLTRIGRIMAGLPLDPCISRVILEAAELGAVREIKIIAAGLTIQDPRIRPAEQEQKADAVHRRFADRNSDFLGLLNIWESYHSTAHKVRSQNRLRKFCTSHFLSWQRMREWLDIHDQICELTSRLPSFRDNSQPASFTAIHQSLLRGFLRNIGQKKEKNVYQVSGGREAMIFPGSALFNHGGPWMVSAAFMETNRLYAMNVATIDVRWLERIGGPLCRRSWSDPHWEKKTGQVCAVEKVTLFGLVIVAGRKVNYGRLNQTAAAEAREIFIRQALVQGDLGGRYSFLRHNRALVRKFENLEERTRRRNIVVDDLTLYSFYADRLDTVFDRHTLNQVIRKAGGDRFLWMTEEDICLTVPDTDELYRFPRTMMAGPHELRLSYLFEPGTDADGVTADIPSALAEELSPALFEWLVPGLIGEKVQALLKNLPKTLRRRLVPLPDCVDRLLDGLELYQGSLYAALEKTIARFYQVNVRRTDWQPDKLPGHLRMRFRLLGEEGAVLYSGRSYQELLRYLTKGKPVHRQAQLPPEQPAVIMNIRTWECTKPPAPIRIGAGAATDCYLYPALVVDTIARAVELHYLADRDESRRCNRIGLRYLYSLQSPAEIKALAAECKTALRSHTASWLSLGLSAQAAEVREILLGFLLDHIFAIPEDGLPSGREFAHCLDSARTKGIIRTGRDMLAALLRLLALRREISGRIQQLGDTTKARRADNSRTTEYRDHLLELLPSDFLTSRNFSQIAQTERYLKALAIRIERAELSPAKDSRKAEQVRKAADRLKQFTAAGHMTAECCRCLAEYRQMVEELRVSVFAPEIGTAITVSEKRLRQKWEEVENLCHPVE